MIAIVPAAHTPTQQHRDRAENASVARTRTQQRRNRAKIARTRMIVTDKSYLRLVRQANAGRAIPSTGAARLRRDQRAKSKAKHVATHQTLELHDPGKDERKNKKRQLEEVIDSSFDAELEQPVELNDPEKDERKNKKRRLEEVIDNSFDAELEKQDCLYGVLDVFVRWIDERRASSVELRD